MMGMLFNGADRDHLRKLYGLLLGLADIPGISFRYDPVPIPTIPVEKSW